MEIEQMIKPVKLAVMILILTLVCNCTEMIVKPIYLYEDKSLYKKIKSQKKIVITKATVKNINELLNNYDTYVDKVHFVITENNKRALK